MTTLLRLLTQFAEHFTQPFSALAVTLVSSALLAGSLLTLAVALLLRMLPPLSASVRSFIWTGLFAMFLIVPFCVASLPATNACGLHTAPELRLDPRWGLLVAALWISVSCYRACRLVAGALRLHALWHGATPIPGSIITTETSFGRPSRTAAVCLSESISKPIVIGFFSPRILLPSALYAQLSADELRSILLHETEHLRRRDDWLNLLQKLGLALFALHPALLWVERRLCFERELACDDRVLQATGAPKRYASCLVDLAERCVLGRHVSLALGAWGARSELSRRVQHILTRRSTSPGRSRSALTVSVLTAVTIAGTIAFLHCPRVVLTGKPLLTSVAPMHAPVGGFQSLSTSAPLTHGVRLIRANFQISQPTPSTSKGATAMLPARRPRSAGHSRPRSAPHVVYTSFDLQASLQPRAQSPSPARLILTVFTPGSLSSSYAAVPYRNGWLIVQL